MILVIGEKFICNDKIISVTQIDQHVKDQNEIIYEVMRFIDSKPLFLRDHLDRFLSAFHFGVDKNNYYKTLLSNYIRKLIDCNNLENGNVRFQFNNNNSQLFCAWLIPFKYPTAQQYKEGVSVNTYSRERTDPNIKSRDIKLRFDVDDFIVKREIYEAILINPDGKITEGSRSNIFFIENKLIISPPLAMILPGITRQKIISLIHEHGFHFEERTVRISEINRFESCFISGTSPKILPVKKIDEQYMIIENPLLKRLIQLYDKLIDTYLENFTWN